MNAAQEALHGLATGTTDYHVQVVGSTWDEKSDSEAAILIVRPINGNGRSRRCLLIGGQITEDHGTNDRHVMDRQ